MKQSLRSYLPALKDPTNFESVVNQVTDNQKFICHFDHENPTLFNKIGTGKPTCLLIGPEGGFTDNELKMAEANGFQSVNISKVRLRTETAEMVAAQIVS